MTVSQSHEASETGSGMLSSGTEATSETRSESLCSVETVSTGAVLQPANIRRQMDVLRRNDDLLCAVMTGEYRLFLKKCDEFTQVAYVEIK
jgi:hypothetical protein